MSSQVKPLPPAGPTMSGDHCGTSASTGTDINVAPAKPNCPLRSGR